MDGRKRLSGAGYRKLAEEKRRKENEVLDQTPKLDTFFVNKVAETGEGSSETVRQTSDSNCGVSDIEEQVNNHLISEPGSGVRFESDFKVSEDPFFWENNEKNQGLFNEKWNQSEKEL